MGGCEGGGSGREGEWMATEWKGLGDGGGWLAAEGEGWSVDGAGSLGLAGGRWGWIWAWLITSGCWWGSEHWIGRSRLGLVKKDYTREQCHCDHARSLLTWENLFGSALRSPRRDTAPCNRPSIDLVQMTS